ncbi:Holliday junction branch migration DNA helicase RuvB [Patescibacteria group bacterium]|nr:Holliday junction branch migration DNA helicase RuvB [Patescibacteria group bacterium]
MAFEPKENIISREELPEDQVVDFTLRPQTLDEFVGQEKLKAGLKIFIEAARQRGEALEHVLFQGSHGLGKTTLSHIIAREMGVNLQITSGPALERAGDLAAILTSLPEGGVLFIDELHRLPRNIEEILYPAMEECALDIVVGKGPSAKTLRLDIPHFTLVGATTKPSLISPPLRDRFGMTYRLNFYEIPEIENIIKRSAKILEIELKADTITELAKRSRFTPRIANRLLKRVRDFAQIKKEKIIKTSLLGQLLELLGVDELGLSFVDREIISSLIQKFSGGPVGLKTLAASIGEDVASLEEIYEPYLIRLGFLNRTSRGRVATSLAYQHLENNKKDLNEK